MARAGYCRHGWEINNKEPEPFEIEVDGEKKTITMPVVKCPYCESEEKARKDALEYKQALDKQMVRENILRLLREDEEFLEEVRKVLSLFGEK